MTFSIADLILLAIAAIFILSGLYHGFIRTFGSLIGLIGGIFIGIFAINWLTQYLSFFQNQIASFIAMIVIILSTSQLIGWIFELIDRAYKLLTIIPFLSGINKLLGGILGVIEAFAVLSTIIYYAQNNLTEGFLQSSILESQASIWLSWASGWIAWVIELFIS